MNANTAHVFYWKWPRIKEGLVHEEIHDWMSVTAIPAPRDAFIFADGRWWMRGSEPFVTGGKAERFTTFQAKLENVPLEFRTRLLLLS